MITVEATALLNWSIIADEKKTIQKRVDKPRLERRAGPVGLKCTVVAGTHDARAAPGSS